ncbi:MAG TPA: ATP-dependent DNA ligase [Opitutaceae bacterium]|nr:ATP-dependent DNA ligase [Opitutaceae bacterium]
MSWDVQFDRGLWLPQVGWRLDAAFPAPRSFISHAHFDHVAPHDEILCSTGTARLLRLRLAGRRTEHVLDFGQTEPLTEDCAATLFPAGHIFGSSQILLEHARHGKLLYTGDFKLRPGLSAEPCATPRADLLIMETTFGRPQYAFPPTEEVLAAIVRFCRDALGDGELPVLFGYSLGKSQELLSRLAAAELPLMLHPQTARMTRVYEEAGFAFPPYREFAAAECAGHVLICPPQAAGSDFVRRLPRRRTAAITGWAMDPAAVYRYQCDAAFPLSDHADFPDLLRFAEAVAPRRILTLHGFAVDFARTLRERGWDAWAVGQGNQLDLRLGAEPVRALAAAPAPPPGSAAPLAGLARFAAVADAVRGTARKGEKVAWLADYLRGLPDGEAVPAAVFLTGRPFAQAEDRRLNLGWALLRRAVLEVAGATEGDFRAAYRQFADGGEAAGALLRSRPDRGVPLAEAAEFFDRSARATGPAAKLDLLAAFLARLGGNEARYLLKIVTGDLRIGLKEGLLEEAIASATGQPPEAVREAHLLCGDMGDVMRAARAGLLGEVRLRVFHPLQSMLASPEPTAEAILARLPPPVWLEEKYDGIRAQVHRRGGEARIYSRDLHDITGQFPDLARAALALPSDFIADGELLAWRGGRALPFAELQKRLGRGGHDFFLGEEIPVSFSAFDLLWVDGRNLLAEPLRERRALLGALLEAGPAAFLLAPVGEARTAREIDAAFLAARGRGNEGLIAKDPGSRYSPGRRGLAWLKLKKAYATLDVVVVAVEYGHGKRREVLSDYTFAVRDAAQGNRLLTVGKAYTGLTDAEIARLTEHFLEQTLEVQGRRRTVVPDTVLEVAFDSIQPSSRHESGFALRFPRINRLRPDKTAAEVDTLETCRRLAGVGG